MRNSKCQINQNKSGVFHSKIKLRLAKRDCNVVDKDALDAALIGAWGFEESGGTVVYDASSNGNNGQFSANPPTRVAGTYGNELQFNGSDNAVTIPASDSLNSIAGSFTVSLRFKYLGEGTPDKAIWTLVNKNGTGSGHNDIFHLFIYSATKRLGFRSGNGATNYEINSGVAVNDGEYHQVDLVYDNAAKTYKLYVDGQQAGDTVQAPQNWTIAQNSYPLTMGYWTTGYASYFNGVIDELQIYDRALAGNEIGERAIDAFVAHRQYDSFGNVTDESGPAVDFIFGYTGKAWDADAELYDYYHRMYDPVVGRFASADPLGLASGDANLYRYVGNNPLNYIDPTGLCGQSWSGSQSLSSLAGALGNSIFPGLGTTATTVASNWSSIRSSVAQTAIDTIEWGMDALNNVSLPPQALLSEAPVWGSSTISTGEIQAWNPPWYERAWDTVKSLIVPGGRRDLNIPQELIEDYVHPAVVAGGQNSARLAQGSARALGGGAGTILTGGPALVGVPYAGEAFDTSTELARRGVSDVGASLGFGGDLLGDTLMYGNIAPSSAAQFMQEVRNRPGVSPLVYNVSAVSEIVGDTSWAAAQGVQGTQLGSINLLGSNSSAVSSRSSFAAWWYRGAENDAAWRALSFQDKVFYEIGQKTLSTAEYGNYANFSAVERGRKLVQDLGWRNALKPQGAGWRLGVGETFNTGPTPLIRYVAPRAAGAAAAGGTTYYILKQIPAEGSK